ncbi:MAG TPA: endonuclease IV [Lachnospiraceae bacterium]|nr:endonuclease IV [Lachnospiraceae bacterium]
MEETNSLTIGCHLSSSKGFYHMGKEAVSIGANTFQFFTRNPRGSRAKAIDPGDVERYHSFAAEHGIQRILAHAPYTLNACSKDPHVREFALETMADDLVRMEHVPGNCYNFHPGSHVGQGSEEGIRLIAETLNAILRPEQHTTVLLETMAGKGSEVGRSFGEIRQIIDRVELSDHVGVCLDTCHVYDAGYDIVGDLDGVLEGFDRTIGLDRLRAVHVNDSKNPFASHKDRHEKIGEGSIGLETFVKIINHPALEGLPFYLETPNELPGYRAEIALLREKYNLIKKVYVQTERNPIQ